MESSGAVILSSSSPPVSCVAMPVVVGAGALLVLVVLLNARVLLRVKVDVTVVELGVIVVAGGALGVIPSFMFFTISMETSTYLMFIC